MDEQVRVRNISDLARLAGVSAGTVSRALSDSALIARKTRERIQALATEHDFRPNIMARNLRIKRAGAIAVVVPAEQQSGQHISDLCFKTLLGHLNDALAARGHDLLMLKVDQSNPDWLHRIVRSGRVDGVILMGESDQQAVIELVTSFYLPLVVWGAHSPDQTHCTVGSDNRTGGELAARHLIERGCDRFTFLGDPSVPEIAERLSGACAVLSENGLAEALTVLPVASVEETAHPAFAEWLGKTEGSRRGLIAASDTIAMSALRALSENGVAVPSEASVIGYDDLPIAPQTVPPLTTIRQDLAKGAAHVVDMLFSRIGGEKTGSLVLQPKLVVRQSS